MSRHGIARAESRRTRSARPGSGTRLVGGAWRGRRLAVARGVRPSEARLREALFSIWQDRLAGCRFLDLFAGSGAVGIEALSRGARRAVLVEKDPRVLAVLRRNAAGLEPAPEVLRGHLPGAVPEGSFDLIFADPPYAFADYHELLRRAAPALAAGGELAIEHSVHVELAPDGSGRLRRHDTRRYGDSCLSFFQPL